MPVSKDRLTHRQEVFAERYAATKDVVYSAEKAGYASAKPRGYELLKHPTVAARVHEHVRDKLLGHAESVPDIWASIMNDPKERGATRLKAGELILGHAGFAVDKDGVSKEPHEMTPDELAHAISAQRARADALEIVAAGRARVVPSSIDDPPGLFD